MNDVAKSKVHMTQTFGSIEPILVAEENEDDILLLYEALKGAEIENPLFVVFDGSHAVDYLAGTGRFQDRKEYPFPSLVLLSTELAGRTGLEVLQWMRQPDNPSRSLPAILFTSQPSKREMKKALDLGAYDYVAKSLLSRDQFFEWAKSLKNSWPPSNFAGAGVPRP